MLYRYKVIVKLKNGVKDAKGEAVSCVIKNANSKYQYADVCVGKYFEFKVEANNELDAKIHAVNIIENTFINPILETYDIFEVEAL